VITIVLRSRYGMAYAVDPHPASFDGSGPRTGERRRDTQVRLHDDAVIAPFAAALHGLGARSAIAPLRAALARLEGERPESAGCIALVRLLLTWSTRWPDAAWHVTGAPAPRPAPNAQTNGKRERALRDDGPARPALVGARVSREVHELFEDRGARAGASAGEVLECVGRALLHGLTIAQLRDRLSPRD
jgi:hypothetical protein